MRVALTTSNRVNELNAFAPTAKATRASRFGVTHDLITGASGSAGRYKNEAALAMRKGQRDQRKEKTRYHKRSLVETKMFQIKQIFGDKMKARIIDLQSLRQE